ncbi:pyridoxine 5'-phosphate synthase [Limimonas halophila]|uniref:Pyridoxine 5'-phosphate synthase n=1 Tax=Limimonas halophila TaxID=1082479 RepID=A0A1G7P3I3_9PROT|nr:pyridoxine 5'-phosphate synthase [Limimonas halophila]SDF80179.1 pyridoxine 5'-phosphate synthase [Limimonas halophila]
MARPLRLGVNIDHVATLRNARGTSYPDPVRAARIAAQAGAQNITAHLREDRRHIVDDDIARLMDEVELPLNMEMAATEEMLAIAARHRPYAVCLVPEKREERTTEGGLDVVGQANSLREAIAQLSAAGSRVSLFIEPDSKQVREAMTLGASAVELHTGAYCDARLAEGDANRAEAELDRIHAAAEEAEELGVECHAGHGLTYDTVGAIAAVPNIVELNIGHFLIGEAVFTGLETAIQRMRAAMDAGRARAPEAAT